MGMRYIAILECGVSLFWEFGTEKEAMDFIIMSIKQGHTMRLERREEK